MSRSKRNKNKYDQGVLKAHRRELNRRERRQARTALYRGEEPPSRPRFNWWFF